MAITNSTSRTLLTLSFLLLVCASAQTQPYFPPNGLNSWDTISPSNLNWCQERIDSLNDFLENNNTKAFILLKDGKIVLEEYFNGHSDTSAWYWASAGKTITAFMVGIAQQENHLNINDTSSNYLGQGWTSLSLSQEDKITIRNQLTMTTGLNDQVPDAFCTIDTCLQYLADAGTRWAYHNAPYTLLDQVIANATSTTLNSYTNQKLKIPTGMTGLFLPQGYNNVYFSTARSMARFGLLILNEGNWDGNQIMTDTNYFNQMVNSSQNINEAYGYLWWLNGKNTFMVPQSQFVFNGSMNPNAPADMFAAMGKNGQFINVIPSQNMVWIRMGDSPDNTLVPFTFNDDIWTYINDLPCNPSDLRNTSEQSQIQIYPNPSEDFIQIRYTSSEGELYYELSNSLGEVLVAEKYESQIDISNLKPGILHLRVFNKEFERQFKLIRK